MDKLIYNTINNDGVLRSSGPHRIIITNEELANKLSQSYKSFPPVIIERVTITKGNTLLKAKVCR